MYRRSVSRSDTESDVITKPKFLALMGLPKSLSYGAPRARSSAISWENFFKHEQVFILDFHLLYSHDQGLESKNLLA